MYVFDVAGDDVTGPDTTMAVSELRCSKDRLRLLGKLKQAHERAKHI